MNLGGPPAPGNTKAAGWPWELAPGWWETVVFAHTGEGPGEAERAAGALPGRAPWGRVTRGVLCSQRVLGAAAAPWYLPS